ncbi:MAG: hypothetical protein SH857_15875 [Chitinophagales bacterium]|nr:hypothetical protein [Chitinophagales bacterium]
MKIPVIKQLAEKYSIPQLAEAETALLEDRAPTITDAGDDAGDQLTNITAAIWIKGEMDEKSVDLKAALRSYTQRVRNSIS